MKKLVVLLASAMMFSFSASAFAFTDMADQSVIVNDAVAKAVALEIIEGYQDGTFRPDATITRAEFAKIAVVAAGAEKTATMLEGTPSDFSDVATSAWYTGWVNAAASLGFVQGDEAGTYRPNDTIKNSEVVAVLLRLLGYNDNLNGSWPTNYITEANKLEVLDDVTISASAAATRGDVAVILDAILDQDLVKYSKDTETFEYAKKGSLLNDSFKGNVREDVTMASTTLKDAEDKTFYINFGGSYYDADKKAEVAYTDSLTGNEGTGVGMGADLLHLNAHQATIVTQTKNDKTTVKFIDITSTSVVTTDAPTYDKAADKAVVNGKKYATTMKASDFDGLAKNNSFTVYFNDDEEVYAIVSDQANNTKTNVVEEVDGERVYLLGETGYEKLDEEVMVIGKDGAIVDASAVKEGDALTDYLGAGEIFILGDVQTGTFSKFASSKYTLDGTGYKAENLAWFDEELDSMDDVKVADYLGQEVSFVVNGNNTVSTIITGEAGVSSTMYGVVVDATEASGLNYDSENLKYADVTIFTEEGKTVTYELTSDAAKTGSNDGSLVKIDGVDVGLNNTPYGAVVSYKLNADGEVKTISAVTDTAATKLYVTDGKYLATAEDGKDYTLASDAVIFNILSDSDDELSVEIVTRAELLSKSSIAASEVKLDGFTTGGKLDATIYIADKTNSSISVMAVVGMDAVKDNEFGIVTAAKYQDGTYNDTEFGIEIDGVAYELAKGNPDKGSLVEYTVTGDKLEVVAEYTDAKKSSYKYKVVAVNDEIVTYNTIADKTTDKKVVIADDAVVYILNDDGDYELGSIADVKKNAWILVSMDDKNEEAIMVYVDQCNAEELDGIFAE